ncbi:MAG: flagellar hook-length control protein FliK [Bacillota bacterium]
MTENVPVNMVQQSSNSFSSVKKEKNHRKPDKSFAETVREVNTPKPDRREKSPPDSGKNQKLNNQEFLDKLKKILSKNRDKTASELIALMQSGSLSEQQKIMMQNLLSELQNNNLNLSELKSLLHKNSTDHANSNMIKEEYFSRDRMLNFKDLEKIASLLENNKITLTEKQQSVLKNELDRFAEMISSNFDNNSDDIMNAETAELKLEKLITLFKKDEIDPTNLETLLKKEDSELHLMQKLKSMGSSDVAFSDSITANKIEKNSISAELAEQLKEMFNEQNGKKTDNRKNVKFSVESLFPSDNDSSLEKIFAAGNTESGSDKNFLDLGNKNLFFSFDMESGDTVPDGKIFSLHETNTDLNQAENADLKSQIVEKFTGEYSADTKEMQIQLEPRSLGKVDISLSYDNGKLVGKMVVENELVRTQLENSLKQLKTDLVKQGINIEQFKVETAKNSPQQVERQNEFVFNDQETASGDGETGQNQEHEQRKFFQGQYYVHRRNDRSNTAGDRVLLKHQEMINRAAFFGDKINLLA